MQKSKRENELINLNNYTELELKELKKHKDYYCPYCQQPVRLRSGPKRRAHFAHIIPCHYQTYENESPEHHMAKKLLAQWLQRQGIQTEIEHPILDIRRIADIYFVRDSKKYAIEIQKSPITEQLFQERTMNYEKLGITVVWIFIGDVIEQQNTFILNRVMTINKELPLLHLQLSTERVTLFHDVIWISTKEIQAQSQKYSLKEMDIDQLLSPMQRIDECKREAWLEIKEEFRKYKWHSYMKQERKLLQVCARYRINLALLPAEVGWPVNGSGFRKSLFIWQAYSLLSITTTYEIGEYFTTSDLIRRLKTYYQLPVTSKSLPQLKSYLNLLIKFGILSKGNGYYEYKKVPNFYDRLEQVLIQDNELSNRIF